MKEGSPHENLTTIWEALQRYYRDFKPAAQLEGLKLSSFSFASNWKKKTPQLKGKANALRHTGEALLAVWQTYMNPANLQHKQIELLLRRSVRLEQIITEQKGNDAFSAAAAREFEDMGFQYLVLMNTLNSYYVQHDALPLFDVTGKCHYLAHCVQRAKYLNTKLTWCYIGEDPTCSPFTKSTPDANCRRNVPTVRCSRFWSNCETQGFHAKEQKINAQLFERKPSCAEYGAICDPVPRCDVAPVQLR